MAHVAKGLPTTKQTAIERPILKKSQPTIGEPSASRQRIILVLKHRNIYRTGAIISRGLYIFKLIFKDHFFVFKEVFSENSVLMYG